MFREPDGCDLGYQYANFNESVFTDCVDYRRDLSVVFLVPDKAIDHTDDGFEGFGEPVEFGLLSDFRDRDREPGWITMYTRALDRAFKGAVLWGSWEATEHMLRSHLGL